MKWMVSLLKSTPLKAEQELEGMELQEKEDKNDLVDSKTTIKSPKVKGAYQL